MAFDKPNHGFGPSRKEKRDQKKAERKEKREDKKDIRDRFKEDESRSRKKDEKILADLDKFLDSETDKAAGKGNKDVRDRLKTWGKPKDGGIAFAEFAKEEPKESMETLISEDGEGLDIDKVLDEALMAESPVPPLKEEAKTRYVSYPGLYQSKEKGERLAEVADEIGKDEEAIEMANEFERTFGDALAIADVDEESANPENDMGSVDKPFSLGSAASHIVIEDDEEENNVVDASSDDASHGDFGSGNYVGPEEF